MLRINFDPGGSGRGGEQGLWQVIADRGILCSADAQAVGPPWFDPDGLVVQIPDKRLMLLFKACQDPILHFLAARCIQFPSEPMGADGRWISGLDAV